MCTWGDTQLVVYPIRSILIYATMLFRLPLWRQWETAGRYTAISMAESQRFPS
jgi:hypothetical protein